MMTTSIQVEKSTWKRLNGLKEPGESFDDVVNKAVDAYESECYECGVQLHSNGPNAVIEGRPYCESCGDAELRARDDMTALAEEQ